MNTNTKDWQKVIDDAKTRSDASVQQEELNQAMAGVDKNIDVKSMDSDEEDHNLTFTEREELTAKLTAAEKLADKYWSDFLRLKADMENFQRRAERDIANAHKYSVEKIAAELLPIIDNLERCLANKPVTEASSDLAGEALNNVYTGVELTLKMFLDVLQKFAIESINPQGEVFNHQYHNAMQVREEDGVAPNTVVQVVQKGYILKDRLLRPALVIVSR